MPPKPLKHAFGHDGPLRSWVLLKADGSDQVSKLLEERKALRKELRDCRKCCWGVDFNVEMGNVWLVVRGRCGGGVGNVTGCCLVVDAVIGRSRVRVRVNNSRLEVNSIHRFFVIFVQSVLLWLVVGIP